MKPTHKGKLADLRRGLLRHPWQTVLQAFAAFSVMWTMAEALDHFLPGVIITGKAPLVVMGLIALIWSVYRIWKPSEIAIKIPTTNTTIEVRFDDIFAQDGISAIPVTEFFETELGQPVSDKSVHGQFIKRYFGGGVQALDTQIASQLAGVPFQATTKSLGKNNSYDIGTTVLVAIGQARHLLFVLAKANANDCKARSDVTLMWDAMRGLWTRARSECGGHPLNVPLIGSGLSGIGLPTRDLLNLIILSAIVETKERQVTARLRIILHCDRFEELDLRQIKKYWEET